MTTTTMTTMTVRIGRANLSQARRRRPTTRSRQRYASSAEERDFFFFFFCSFVLLLSVAAFSLDLIRFCLLDSFLILLEEAQHHAWHHRRHDLPARAQDCPLRLEAGEHSA